MSVWRLPASGGHHPSMVLTHFAAGLAVALSLATPNIALGESDVDRAAARSTAQSGLNAYKAGRYAEAFDLLRRAESVLHAPTHCVYMARAADKLGHLVQARELYLKVTRETQPASAPPAFVEAKEEAERELLAIESRIPYLTIETDTVPPPGTKIKLDDRELQDALIGVPIPVDPGEHTIMAVASSGAQGPSTRVRLSEGKRQEVTARIPTHREATTVTSAVPVSEGKPQGITNQESEMPGQASPATGSGAPSTPARHNAQPSSRHSLTRIVANSAIGIGVAGAVVGTVFVVRRGSKKFEADSAFDDCRTRYCDPSEIEHFIQLDRDAAKAGTLAWVSYGVGAAALTTGLYLLLTAHPERATAQSMPAFVPYVGPMQAGATVRF